MPQRITPEAYGVLQALDNLKSLRRLDPAVERELAELKYAKKTRGRLFITPTGHHAAKTMRAIETAWVRRQAAVASGKIIPTSMRRRGAPR